MHLKYICINKFYQNQNDMETQEMKQRIKDYFVEIKEDKFTKVKSIKCKHKIEWKGKELENKFMLTKDSYSNSLSMSIDYRHKDDVDSVFFGFTYSNSDGGYPGMTNIKMYLILDDDKTIELSEGSGFDHASQSSKVGDNYISVYIETAQLAVSMSDFIAIVNAKKIEYSIRFGQGSLENIFTQNDLMIFKGFYNAAFDSDFETESLYSNNISKINSSIESTKASSALVNDKELQNLIDKYKISNEDILVLWKLRQEMKNKSFWSKMTTNQAAHDECTKILKRYDVSFLDRGAIFIILDKKPL